MSENLQKFVQNARRKEKKKGPQLSAKERLALHNIRVEAKKAGAKLASNGEGGLSPLLVIKVFRRDEYTCKVHGDRGEGDCGGLTVHHKGGIVESDWLSSKGHRNLMNNLVIICSKAHDQMHEEAKAAGTDSSQVEPEGDKR